MSFSQIWIHSVWATKNRYPFLTKDIRIKLFEKFREIAKDKSYFLDTTGGIDDHVHIIFSMRPNQIISNIIKDFKGISSKWINDNNITEEYFEWQEGFSAFSISPWNVELIRNYIKNQEQHHKNQGFDDELKRLNKSEII
ncbi:MAG TPA: IS200/IS605 family transposase [Bacteroidia bacterium]|nr:IS200/IS605 family transposase [Bacteroidia bacterium]HRS58904.1 IS200/IS605 family transposase [Bacteroidia bacterium]HRU67400.1 IS200/IS605 family transposase [Bacteroidia bacterium]